VLDAYAALCGLSMVITDPEGQILTRISGISVATQQIMNNQSMPYQETMRQYLPYYKEVHQPTIFDPFEVASVGMKGALAPLLVNGQLWGVVWAGVFVEQGTVELVRERMSGQMPGFDPMLLDVLHQVPVLNGGQKQALLDNLTRLSHVIRTLLEGQERDVRFQRIMELIVTATSGETRTETILQRYLQLFPEVELLGEARREPSGAYRITQLYSESCGAALLGLSVAPGEGLLGQAALFKQFRYWEQLAHDPRRHQFVERDVPLEQFFILPERTVTGGVSLLFGGTTQQKRMPKQALELIQILDAARVND